MCLSFVFFFKQKTAYEMRISDWSSDVCSSDLAPGLMDGKAMKPFASWRRSPLRLYAREPHPRFDAAAAVVISHADQLAAMVPRFSCSLSAQFDVEGLAGRLSPVLLEDRTVALFALAEHVGGDQADELARRDRKSTRLNSSH